MVRSISIGRLQFLQGIICGIQYNILLKWSELYGINPYLYYIYATIPFIFAGYLIPLVMSAISYAPNFKYLLKKTQPKEAHKEDDEKKKKKSA